MKLELKNIKSHRALSEETECFSATLYVNGVRAATVSNRGTGGCHQYHWLEPKLGPDVVAWADTQKTEFEHGRLDQLVDRLLSEADVRKQLSRDTRRLTLFRLAGDQRHTWRTVNRPWSPAVQDFLRGKYGNTIEVIANQDMEKAVTCSL